MSRFAIVNANIITPIDINSPSKGENQGNVMQVKHMLVEDGFIKLLTNDFGVLPECETIDLKGALVTPGLIDPHTHLVHGGSREREIPLKLQGASYMEIHHAGGGINSTVIATRRSSKSQLKEKALEDLKHMLSLGVTTVESKSGYGLNLEDEIKTLEVSNELDDIQSLDIVHTFMGAHSIPQEYKQDSQRFIDLVTNEMMPLIKDRKLAEFCDVFCEDGVFDVEQSRNILQKAKEFGFKLKIHADEIVSIGGAELAAELNAISADHLMAVSKQGIRDLAKSNVIAVLLPGTSFYLGKNYAPAREMIANNVPIALASDFNPGSCPSDNFQFIMNLGYLYLRMKPEEVLTACTLNAAYAIDRASDRGSLTEGKIADFVVWNSENLEYLMYRFGKNHVKQVWKDGKKVYEGN
jgi:imidazolonepropionase